MIVPPTSVTLSKLLLLACDQSYFDGTHPAATVLQSLDDKAAVKLGDPYGDQAIYRSISPFDADGQCSGYNLVESFADTIHNSGAKYVLYQNPTSGDVIVAFGGTDGSDMTDWKSNTQSLGWDQWLNLAGQRGQRHLIS